MFGIPHSTCGITAQTPINRLNAAYFSIQRQRPDIELIFTYPFPSFDVFWFNMTWQTMFLSSLYTCNMWWCHINVMESVSHYSTKLVTCGPGINITLRCVVRKLIPLYQKELLLMCEPGCWYIWYNSCVYYTIPSTCLLQIYYVYYFCLQQPGNNAIVTPVVPTVPAP